MEANDMEPGTWDESSQALQEFQRGHDEMGCPIPVRGFGLEDDLTGWGAAVVPAGRLMTGIISKYIWAWRREFFLCIAGRLKFLVFPRFRGRVS